MSEQGSSRPPKLVKRRDHKKSSFQAGRTIGEKRERLETANERAAARKKDKQKKASRIIFTTAGFLCVIGILILLFLTFTNMDSPAMQQMGPAEDAGPTIEIIDESDTSGGITSRMRDFIGQLEVDLQKYNIKATRAVVPSGSIREVRIYLEGYDGYIKTLIDRGTGVTAEDIDRALRYLKSTGVNRFEYLDVRIEGKAYWK